MSPTERQLYEAGHNVREVAAIKRISVATAHRRLVAQHTQMGRAGQPLIGPADERATRAAALRAKGHSYREIAAIMGCGVAIAHKYVERASV